VPTVLVLLVGTVIAASELVGLLIMIFADLFTLYFLVSSVVGYVELRENTLFIRFGFFITREIPYAKIRSLKKERRVYSESMLALKNSLDHVDIRYNSFDVVSVSVKGNDDLIAEIEARKNEKPKSGE
jgi:hypothetical protein